MNKKDFIKVNLSSTFPLKSRCKYCSSDPKHYYLARTISAFQDHEVIIYINMWIASNHKRMCKDYYLAEMPRNYNVISNFGHSVDYKGYSPRYHRNSKYHNLHANLNMIDYVTCRCGKTRWAFNDTVARYKRETIQRKSRVLFKTKYLY